MERNRPTKAGLVSLELMIAIGVFSFCAAICIGLFVQADLISKHSSDTNNAIHSARSVSEIYKSASGDIQATAQIIDENDLGRTELDGDTLTVWYECDGTELRLELAGRPKGAFPTAEVSVYSASGERHTGWLVAALETNMEGVS